MEKIGTKDAISAVIHSLKNGDQQIRLIAVSTLEKIGGVEVIPSIELTVYPCKSI